MNATQDHTISRRKQKKNAEKLKRAQTSGQSTHSQDACQFTDQVQGHVLTQLLLYGIHAPAGFIKP